MAEPRQKSARQRWASPRSVHDRVVKVARIVLPSAIGVLGTLLILAPLSMTGDVSFVLAKDTVAMAKERLRVMAATYRGEDGNGQPFVLRAGSAVQASSREPVVKLQNLSANITLPEGPATFAAANGRYNMDQEVVHIDGPVVFDTSDGYRLATRDVAIGLKTRKLASGGPVEGQMPLGTFSAGQIRADLEGRSVVLEGGAHLHIVQGRAR